MRAKGKQTPFHQKVKIFIYIYLPSKEGHLFNVFPKQKGGVFTMFIEL